MKNAASLRALCITAFLIFIPTSATEAGGFFSNPLGEISHALGGVARGIGNIFGQGIAGLAGPTINNFTDDVNKILAERLVQADNMLTTRIAQVDANMTKQLDHLDGVIEDKIDKLDKILDQKIGAVDIVATKTVQSAEDSLVAVLRFGVALVLVACIIFVCAKMTMTRSIKSVVSSPPVLSGLVAIILSSALAITASYIFSPPAGARIAKLAADFQNASFSAYTLGELSDASVYAKQLTVIDPTSVQYAAFYKTSEIQRDILYRPTVLKSPSGATELLPRIRRLQQFVNDPAIRDAQDDFSRFLVEQASATSAVVIWQQAQAKSAERDALCAAADALAYFSSGQGHKLDAVAISRATPFTWLSYSYARWGLVIYRGAVSPSNCRSGVPVYDALMQVAPLLDAFDKSAPPDSIEHVVKFNRMATVYFAQAAPLYTSMMVHDAAFIAMGEPIKTYHKKQRDQMADRLMGLWSQFSENVRADPSIAGNDIGIAAIGLPAALAFRAEQVRDVTDPAARGMTLAACAAVVNDVIANGADLKGKYEKLMPPADPEAKPHVNAIYNLATIYQSKQIRNMICSEQLADDALLMGTEKDLNAAVSLGIGPEMDKRKTIATSNTLLAGLAICVPKPEAQTASKAWIAHPVCADADFGPQLANGTATPELPFATKPFVEWLLNAPVEQDQVRYAMVR